MNPASSDQKATSIDMSKIKRGPIVFALIIGAFVAILNETLLGNALPDLVNELGVSYSTIQWLSTAYMLVVGVLVPVTAILQEWFSTRQMFLSSMILFFAGTLIAAVSPGFELLLVGRIVQALGTGLMLPVMMNTILVIFPPEKRGGAMGLMGLVIMFAPAIGPTVSGLILDSTYLSDITSAWRWLFILVLPLAAFSIIFAAIFLKNVSTLTKPKVDVLSILLSTIGFGGVVYGFSKAGENGWGDMQVYLPIIVGGVAILLFIWRQLTLKAPVMDLRAFKFPMFTIVSILMLVLMMTLFSSMTLIPLFLQGALFMTAFKSGLMLLPGGVVNGVMAPISGKLFDKFGPRVLVIPGLIVVVVALWLFTRFDASTSSGYIITAHIIMLIGLSMVMMPAQTTGLNQLPPSLYPHGTAILNTLQQVSGAIGTALFISIMSNGTKDYMSSSKDPTSPAEIANGVVAGITDAFWIGLILAVVALIIGLFIRRTKAPEGQQAGSPGVH